MKLIIDIDEKRFKDIQRIASIQIRRKSLTCEQIIANGTPLETEFEKIKTEIGKEFVDLQDGSEEWRSYVNEVVLECYEIVGRRISELKENKE